MLYSFELEKYLGELLPEREPLLLELEEQALRETIPVVTPTVGNFLAWLVRAGCAERILEIGTAIGYSTIWLAKGLENREGRITTIDLNVDRATRAAGYLERAGIREKVEIRMGDARKILPEFESGAFDFVFIDAAKGEYLDYLELVAPLVSPGGILVMDNVLFRGWVVPGAEYAPKYEKMVRHLRDFLAKLAQNPEYALSVLPFGDGLALCQRHKADHKLR